MELDDLHDDDGPEYEIEILSDGVKYEFEIDAYTGEIRGLTGMTTITMMTVTRRRDATTMITMMTTMTMQEYIYFKIQTASSKASENITSGPRPLLLS